MKKETALRLITGFVTVLLATTCLASPAGTKSARMRIAAVETTPATGTQVLNKAKDDTQEQELLAMGRRIQEEAASGAPVATNLKTNIELPPSCVAGETCSLAVIVENKSNVPVMSPVLGSMSLGLAGGANAVTTTTGWTCGYADPKLTCASTGVVMQPGEKARFIIDWSLPKIAEAKAVKVCFSLVWPGRPKDGVYRAEQIAAVQYALKRAGFETGGIDGRIRPKTLQAIRLLREVVGIPGPSQITPDLLSNLFGEVGKISRDANPADDTACGELNVKPEEKKQVIASAAPHKQTEPAAATKTDVTKLPDLPATSEKEADEEVKKTLAAAKAAKEADEAVKKTLAEAKTAKTKVAAIEAPAPAEDAAKKPATEIRKIEIVKQEPKPEAAKPAPQVAAVKPTGKPPASVQKQVAPSQAKTAVSKMVASAAPSEKSAARLEPSETAPKNRTVVRSTIAPQAYPDIDVAEEVDMPAESEDENVAHDDSAPSYARKDEPVIVPIRDDRRDGGIYHRSAEDTDPPEYYVIDRDSGSYRLSSAPRAAAKAPPRQVAQVSGDEARDEDCTCKPQASKSEAARPRKNRKGDRLRQRQRGYIPTGAEVVAGWPYRKGD